jgi:hypothetical protein
MLCCLSWKSPRCVVDERLIGMRCRSLPCLLVEVMEGWRVWNMEDKIDEVEDFLVSQFDSVDYIQHQSCILLYCIFRLYLYVCVLEKVPVADTYINSIRTPMKTACKMSNKTSKPTVSSFAFQLQRKRFLPTTSMR